MPRYFFNITDGERLVDVAGSELDDITAAKAKAARLAGSYLASSKSTNFWSGDPWTLDCCDERGLILFTISFYGQESAATKLHANP